VYQNQKAIGPAIADSGVQRSEIFITSKLWNSQHSPSNVEAALDDTLKELGLEYLDLYLIHWPVAFPAEGNPHDNLFPKENGVCKIDSSVSVVDTWKAMIKLLDTGKTKAIGVSNFSIEAVRPCALFLGHDERSSPGTDLLKPGLAQIDAITKATGVAPAVHQVERHPRLLQRELIKHHKANNMCVSLSRSHPSPPLLARLVLTPFLLCFPRAQCPHRLLWLRQQQRRRAAPPHAPDRQEDRRAEGRRRRPGPHRLGHARRPRHHPQECHRVAVRLTLSLSV